MMEENMKDYKNMILIEEFNNLRGVNEKINFIQKNFWDKAKVIENYRIDYSGMLKNEKLILFIFEDSILRNDLIIAYEANFVCLAVSTLKCEVSRNLINEYNEILSKTPWLKKVFEINF
jgi:hypothetical protein